MPSEQLRLQAEVQCGWIVLRNHEPRAALWLTVNAIDLGHGGVDDIVFPNVEKWLLHPRSGAATLECSHVPQALCHMTLSHR
jgi:hypothetical protein